MLRFLVLAAMWLGWSGHYTLEQPLIAAFGVFSCLVAYLLAARMRGQYPRMSGRTLGLSTIAYMPWLLWEILKANLAVARIILDPALPIRRQIVRVRAGQRGEGARVLHANSITLTPGTISLAIRGDYILVHAIDDAAAEGVVDGKMDAKVKRLETRP